MNLLSKTNMNFINIKSGSKGNASLIFDDKTLILVDVGVNKKDLVDALKSINKKIEDIDLILLTHNHVDHIKGLRFVDETKIYCVNGIIEETDEYHTLNLFEDFSLDDFTIIPLKTSHDVDACSGFLFRHKENDGNIVSLGYITDTGYLPFETLHYLKDLEYYYFESNYDIYALITSSRPYDLKERILSYRGHLSNEQAAIYLSYLIGDKTISIMLAHLSEECNEPNIARNTFLAIISQAELKINHSINLVLAKQRAMTALPLTIEEEN